MKTKSIVITAVSIITVIGIGVGGYFYYKQQNPTSNAAKTVTKEATIKKGDVAVKIVADGEVQANIANVNFSASDVITEINVKLGDHVTPGQKLASINNSKLNELYKAAMANANKAYWEKNKIDVNVAPESYYAAQQTLNAAWYQTEVARLNFESANLYSQVDGYVIAIKNNVGEIASSNSSTPFITIMQTNSQFVAAKVDEEQVMKISVGTEVLIQIDSLSSKPFAGTVTYISPYSTKDSAGYNSYDVNISFKEFPANLRQGLSASVSFITKKVENVLSLSVEAVSKDSEGQFITIISGESITEKKYIKTGFTDGNIVEISGEGITEGQKVQYSWTE